MINIFLRVLFLCSIVLYMSILLTLSCRHPHYPPFIHHFKRQTWVDGPRSGVCRPKREQSNFQSEGHDFVLLRWKPKNRMENRKERWEKTWNALAHPHSFSFSLSFSLFFSLSLSRCVPRGLGFSCNLSIGFSFAYPATCPPSYLLLLDHFLFRFYVRLTTNRSLSLSLFQSLSSSLFLLSLLSFLMLLSVCLQHVCDGAAWQEGRQADGHWDLEWLRSGVSGAHGEHVFPTSLECQRTPIQCHGPQTTSRHWGRRVPGLWVHMFRPIKNSFAIMN